jgi:hypothetical protein
MTKETAMLYKTMVLELLQQRPKMHEQLRRQRRLLAALDLYAGELKASHEAWKEQLSQARPGSSESQITSVALEMALKHLEDCLLPASPLEDNDPLSLVAALEFLHRHTPPG